MPMMADEKLIDQALKLIAERAPDLAVRASKARARRHTLLKQKQVNELAAQALASQGFSAAERELLSSAIAAVEDDTYADLLRIRVTRAQLRELEAEAAASGSSVSEVVRRRLFKN